MTVNDMINKPKTISTQIDIFNIHGEITFKKDVDSFQKQFNSTGPYEYLLRNVKFSLQNVFQAG